MKKLWSDKAWSDYLYWQLQDKKTLKRINNIIRDIERAGRDKKPMAKAEKLRYSNNNLFSVRIDKQNRIIYAFHKDALYIVSCRGHYK